MPWERDGLPEVQFAKKKLFKQVPEKLKRAAIAGVRLWVVGYSSERKKRRQLKHLLKFQLESEIITFRRQHGDDNVFVFHCGPEMYLNISFYSNKQMITPSTTALSQNVC